MAWNKILIKIFLEVELGMLRLEKVRVFTDKIQVASMVYHKKALHNWYMACSKRSDGGERCEVKEAIPLPLPRFYFFVLLFTSHRSALSERLEQANWYIDPNMIWSIL